MKTYLVNSRVKPDNFVIFEHESDPHIFCVRADNIFEAKRIAIDKVGDKLVKIKYIRKVYNPLRDDKRTAFTVSELCKLYNKPCPDITEYIPEEIIQLFKEIDKQKRTYNSWNR